MNWLSFLKLLSKCAISVLASIAFAVIGFFVGLAFPWVHPQPDKLHKLWER
jgi:hypothetical protein